MLLLAILFSLFAVHFANKPLFVRTFIRNSEILIPKNFITDSNCKKATHANRIVTPIDQQSLTPINADVYEDIKFFDEDISDILNIQGESDNCLSYTCETKEELVDWISDGREVIAKLSRSSIHRYNLLHRGVGVIIINSQGQVFVHQRSSTKRIFPSLWDMFIGGVSGAGEAPEVTLTRELYEEAGLQFNVEMSPAGDYHLPWSTQSQHTWTEFLHHYQQIFRAEFPSSASLPSQASQESSSRICRNMSSTSTALSSTPSAGPVGGDGIRYLGETVVHTELNNCLVDCYCAVCSESTAQTLHFRDGEIERGQWMTLQQLSELLDTGETEFVPDGLQVWSALALMLGAVTD